MDQWPNPELFLVDDDIHVRDLLSTVFGAAGYKLTCFGESNSFLTEARKRTPTCVLLDIHMPGCSGLDTLTKIDAHHFGAPIVIEKPFEIEEVLVRVRAAIEGWNRKASNRHAVARQPGKFHRQELLTPREHEVLAQIAKGNANKDAAVQLGISPRTVEVHRFRIMEKLQAKNAADLMRIVLSWDASTAPGLATVKSPLGNDRTAGGEVH
jgi:FixJ family two-component response regulator